MAKNLQISAVILAGGKASRLGGVDKGLQLFQGKPLVGHILERLAPQINDIWLNINRSFAQYQALFPTIPSYHDELADFQGALSGMLSGFHHIDADYLLFVPCDSPYLPSNLVQKLTQALRINQAQIAYAHDGERPHPTFALLHRSTLPALQAYLANGERRLFAFFQTQKSIAVDFSTKPSAFQNFNTPAEFANSPITSGQNSQKISNPKLLAITGYSGTGKTTLLEKLIPVLRQRQIHVGLIKHSHHNVDVDKAGKDSHRLRAAGANPTMVVCEQRWALMVETEQLVPFEQLVAKMAQENVDLILLEGFKHEKLPKIQLHRKAMEKPLPKQDQFTLATATDYPLACENLLDINNIEQIADFIQGYLKGTLHI
ncbi:molybdenum cofactor guanylyltransferase MobA [Bibersteinia trehalosi]|uniref:molybdenum cofactor guanylyltransferase MobA n=1 Tax=Bibersteinia trehalosi TaxID=47735 RepID=UPI002D76DC7E|nr:molybdenum cofactor guanylyltransferase MobA [Bibersteinia trehalosi]